MAHPRLLDIEFLRECLSCDPEAGLLMWKRRPRHHFKSDHEFSRWNTRYSGKPAGHIHQDGYRKFPLAGRQYSAHRVIWKMTTGEDPFIVDHINRDTQDDRFINLRAATKSQNTANSKVQRNNKLGIKGVEQMTAGSFRAKIRSGDRLIQLGSYPTAEEAHAAYCNAAREIHGEFWSPG